MHRFRADVEGMRAVAVLAVVLYHADVVSGGFVGVDVFFVLSGFLITGLLWREVDDTGRVGFASFYGRRVASSAPRIGARVGRHGDRIRALAVSKAVCPPLDLAVYSPVLDRDFDECTRRRNAAIDRIGAEHPAAVVIATACHYGPEYHFTLYGRDWIAGLERTIGRIRATGAPVVVLGPMPHPPGDVPSCLSANLRSATKCGMPLLASIPFDGYSAEAEAATRAHADYVDVAPWFCARAQCPAIVGNLLVYRDDNHVTTTYAQWLSGTISRKLDAVVRS